MWRYQLRLMHRGYFRGYDTRTDATLSNSVASAGLFFVAALTPKTLDLVDSRSIIAEVWRKVPTIVLLRSPRVLRGRRYQSTDHRCYRSVEIICKRVLGFNERASRQTWLHTWTRFASLDAIKRHVAADNRLQK